MRLVSPQKRSVTNKFTGIIKKPRLLVFVALVLTIPFTFYMIGQQTRSRQNAALTDTFITPGTVNLTATYNSVGIEALFDGDNNQNAKAELEFKKKSETNWRKGLPLWGTYDGASPGRAFYGSALLLDPGVEYEIKITFTDADGVTGSQTITKSIATRADTIPAASSLNPTHYVRTDGNDANSGTADSTAGAWQTIQKALTSAPSGAVVQVGPGIYKNPGNSTRTTPLVLKAQFPAVDDSRNIINPGKHSIIESAIVTAPNSGAWQKVTLTGATTGIPRTVYKWTLPNSYYGPSVLAYATARDGMPNRIGNWDYKSDTVTDKSGKVWRTVTPAGWADVLYENATYNYGWTAFQNGSGGVDIYVRMHGDVDPNSVFMFPGNTPYDSSGNGTGILNIDGPDIRFSGFETHLGSVYASANAQRAIIDHNLTGMTGLGSGGYKPSSYAKDTTIQYNKIMDSNLWSTDPNNPALPWCFIKCAVSLPDGTSGWGRVGANSESTAVGMQGNQTVIRHNTIDGAFNGVGTYNAGFDRYASYGTDIHDNLITHISDDAFEPEQVGSNIRIWNNRIENTAVILSTGPLSYGPLYLFKNEIWKIGNLGVGATNNGSTDVGTVGFKYSGSGTYKAKLFVVNNTYWADTPGVDGSGQYAGGGTNPEYFYLRNNIFRMTRYAFAAPVGPRWDENFNHFYTSDPERGVNKYLSVASYRTATSMGGNTNLTADFHDSPDSFFKNAVSGDLSLTTSSPVIDKGVVVPNIVDNYDAKSSYLGSAPDLGAIESGGTGNPVATPTTGQAVTPTPTTPTNTTPTIAPVGGVNPATTLSVSPGLISVTATKSYLSSITINTQNSVTNADLSLTFNPAIMEVTDATLGNFLPNAREVKKTIDNVNGKVLFSFYTDSTNAKTGTGTLAYIAWKVKAAGSVTLAFDPATTIVFGLGGGNVISQTIPATYQVSAPTQPTPTATPTTPPATNTPIPPTNTPTSPSCTVSDASWSLSDVDEGTLVTLRASAKGNGCKGKKVKFTVRENDSLLEGGLDEDALTQPTEAIIEGELVSTTWRAEWQNDCNGLCNTPEYYFNTTLEGGNTTRSQNPPLNVKRSARSFLLKLRMPYLKENQDLLNSVIEIRSTENGQVTNKTVTLAPGTDNVYTATIQSDLPTGKYDMLIKRHQFLAKKHPFTLTDTPSDIDLSTESLIGGDVNNDNVINTLDLGKVIEEYSPQTDTTATSDLTRDKRINALDLGIIIENYFKQGASF